MKKQYFVAAAIVILAAVFFISALLYNTQKTDKVTAAAQKNASFMERDYSPKMGDANAKVTIVEFFDPACQTCKNFHSFIKHLMASNPGKIKLVMRYTPLHDGSDEVVKILEAARLQNKYWETLETTYDTQSIWAVNHKAQSEILWRILVHTKLDTEKAKQDVQSPAVVQHIQQDMADARQLQVSKTPGFFVNGKPLVRFGYEQLQELVETEIRKNY